MENIETNKNILQEKTRILIEFDFKILGYMTEETEVLAKEVFSDEELRAIVMEHRQKKSNIEIAAAQKITLSNNKKNSRGGFGTPPKGRYS